MKKKKKPEGKFRKSEKKKKKKKKKRENIEALYERLKMIDPKGNLMYISINPFIYLSRKMLNRNPMKGQKSWVFYSLCRIESFSKELSSTL